MKILFLDLGMGAAGDMLAGALYELIKDKEDFIKEINAAGIPGVEVKAQPQVKCGIYGTHMTVTVNGAEEKSIDFTGSHEDHVHKIDHKHESACSRSTPESIAGRRPLPGDISHAGGSSHIHRSMAEIEVIIDSLNVSEKVKSDAKAVYRIIAEAESRAHGRQVSEIHFHEIGSMDAVADITAVCMLMEKLKPDKVIASPVCTGFGHVHAGHGVIPVPAPATANILEGIPSYEGAIEAELCTPTGAALVKYFAGEFGRMPVLYKKKTGYGMGTKDFEACNALRAVSGESTDISDCRADISFAGPAKAAPEILPGHDEAAAGDTDRVIELSLTVDDMTGEEIGFACEKLFEAGALDVYTCPVYMKKNRPGCVIDILVKESQRGKIIPAVFKYTTTLGIREAVCERYILKRKTEIIETEFGPVKQKVSEGYGKRIQKPEYEDLAELAAETGLSIIEIRERIKGIR